VAYAPRLALILDACRYVDAVAKNVIAVYDDLANIDANSEGEATSGESELSPLNVSASVSEAA
jgi:hypothetical protein